MDDEADFGDGVTAKVNGVRAVEAEASGAGEISGPALAFTIQLGNGSPEAVTLDTVNVVLLQGEQDSPALPVFGDSLAKPFTGTLKPDANQQGVYLFTLPVDQRDDVTLTVSYESISPIVAFKGSVAN
ncbi:MAG: hypothetical protein WCF36_07700 [Candidatus Nanopelagicales bacterium]